MSRLPTPAGRPATSRLGVTAPALAVTRPSASGMTRAATSAAIKRPATSQASAAAGAKRTKLTDSAGSDCSSSQRSVSGRPPRVNAAGSMRVPTRPGMTRARSGSSLVTPASRPAGARAGTRVGGALNDATNTQAELKQPGKPASKRQPWDLKGRLLDMEQVMNMKTSQHDELMARVSKIEAEKVVLQEGVREKVVQTAEIQSEVQRLQGVIRRQEDSATEERRQLERQLADLRVQLQTVEAERDGLHRQRRNLEAELTAKTEEAAALKVAVGQMTAAQSTIKVQLDAAQVTVEQLQATLASRDQQVAALTGDVANLKGEVAQLEETSRRGETLRRQLHNQVQELKGNIRVFCRVRPLLPTESSMDASAVIRSVDADANCMEVTKPGAGGAADERRETVTGRRREQGDDKISFSFDRVFPAEASQAVVFDEIAQLIQSALDGYNVCVFAYGQTGSGKTYTMEGGADAESEGMIPRAVGQIFEACRALEEQGWKYETKASFLEIYNETIRDLLHQGKDKQVHEIRMRDKTSKTKEVYVSNLKEIEVNDEVHLHSLLVRARQHRSVAATNCNEHSSRSHSVFTLKLSGANKLTTETSHGSLNLVDLAGSERLKESGSTGDRLTETKSINSSLSNLGNVITALANKQDHVPYRNSKLTHLLQHSLGGNSKTLMFVNVSPRDDCGHETLNSLRFAAKVNQCTIGTATKRTK